MKFEFKIPKGFRLLRGNAIQTKGDMQPNEGLTKWERCYCFGEPVKGFPAIRRETTIKETVVKESK